MNIYFSCSITGGRKDQAIYQQIVRYLVDGGHTVPTAHLASPNLEMLEKTMQPDEVYRRDIDWVRKSDVLIAEVSTPSHGVGYEIAEAVNKGKPVLCLYHAEARVSKIITGNQEANYDARSYRTIQDVENALAEFLTANGG